MRARCNSAASHAKRARHGKLFYPSILSREESSIVTVSTTSKRALNFNAGPAALPLPVLERIREEITDYRGSGMSVMEMSHRSAEYEEIQSRAEQSLRRQLAIPDDYAVLFLQGGGSLQFAMVPMNLYLPGKPVDVMHTGAWTKKAIDELKKVAEHRLAASTEAEKFVRFRALRKSSSTRTPRTFTSCSNNTIEGTEWSVFPTPAPCRWWRTCLPIFCPARVDVRRCGLIFAGAQKNLGPVRRDRGDRAARPRRTRGSEIARDSAIPHAHKERSLYNTPPTFAVYILGFVMEWVERGGRPRGHRQAQRSQGQACSTTRSTPAAATTRAPSRNLRARR